MHGDMASPRSELLVIWKAEMADVRVDLFATGGRLLYLSTVFDVGTYIPRRHDL